MLWRHQLERRREKREEEIAGEVRGSLCALARVLSEVGDPGAGPEIRVTAAEW